MTSTMKISIVGLDSSHSIEFTRRLQSEDCPAAIRVAGMKVVSCLRFETPFQNSEGLDARQKQLESWGVHVTEDFDTCVADCDAIIIAINDPIPHLAYFKKCVDLGKPIFIDKPLANTLANGVAIQKLAASTEARVISCSSLRYAKTFVDACAKIPTAAQTATFGPLGKAPAGSSIVWYGVHAFEMLERAMGRGAMTITTIKSPSGIVAVIEYPDGRRGTVELTQNAYQYGGAIRGNGQAAAFVVEGTDIYSDLLREVHAFFSTGEITSLVLEDAVEVMALLDACQRSFDSGKTENVHTINDMLV